MMSNFFYKFKYKVRIFLKQIFNNIFTGFFILLPIFASIIIIYKLFVWLDSLTHLVFPAEIQRHIIPGLGILLLFFMAWLVGLFAKNFIGSQFINAINSILAKIPFFNKIYGILKQITEAISNPKKRIFDKVVLVEFPDKNSYALAFLTVKENTEISEKKKQKMVGVFIPKVPNPTAGFLIFVPESKVCELNMSIETALKLIVSGGVVSPDKSIISQSDSEIKQVTLKSLKKLFQKGKINFPDPRD